MSDSGFDLIFIDSFVQRTNSARTHSKMLNNSALDKFMIINNMKCKKNKTKIKKE